MGKKIVIVGGGIAGLSCAYYLFKEGHQVTVLDKSDMSDGASYVNAGYITPSHIIPMAAPGMISTAIRYMFNSSSPFYMKPRFDADFLRWAWYFKKSATKEKVERAIPIIKDINILSRKLFEEIKRSGDLGDFHLERKGLMMLYQTQKAGDHEMQVAEKAKFLDLEVNQLNSAEIKKLEPKIKIDALGAVHYECDAHTSPNEFMQKMKRFLHDSGVDIKKGVEVLDIKLSHDNSATVYTRKEQISTEIVVLAAGSWTGKLSKKIGVKMPLQAGKGYRINVERETGITMPTILMESKIAVTPMRGFTRFTGTMEFSGINNKIRKERVEAIANGATAYYPDLKILKEEKDNAQCGLRPVTPDGLPYIGPLKKHSNLIFATGHAMMGWSLGPATGKLVSEIISERKTVLDMSPFNPERKF